MRSGKYRQRLRLQRKTRPQDPASGALGAPVWTDVATVWGALVPLSAREFIAAGAQQAEIVARAEIRYRPGLTAGMRLLHGATVYVLAGPPLPDAESGRRHLTLMLSSGVRDD